MGKAITTRFIHGISIGIFLDALLILKTNNVLQPFLIILLVILIIALEIAFWVGGKGSKTGHKKDEHPLDDERKIFRT